MRGRHVRGRRRRAHRRAILKRVYRLSAILLVLAAFYFVFNSINRFVDKDKPKSPVDISPYIASHDNTTAPSRNDEVPQPTVTPDETDAPSQEPPSSSTIGQASRQDSWYLILVNPDHPIEADYKVELAEMGNGQEVDIRIQESLNKMMGDCRAQGLSPLICSSYRTYECQEELFNIRTRKNLDQGMSNEQAIETAKKVVAYPGTSEHHTGLAVDIVSASYQILDDSQEETQVFQWMKEHCAEYGFILRYPADKTEITKIIYEPWHFRYVGVEAAQEITSKDLCLEEYLSGNK